MNGDLYLISNGELSALLPHVNAVARDAGALIMGFYKAAVKTDITIKKDGSPVTQADTLSSELIETRLAQLMPGIAVVSEENSAEAPARGIYWSVDPLDGTKEFIGKTDGFAVKIALMDQGEPVLAVVYAPAMYSLYNGLRDGLATRQTGINQPKFLSVRENSKWDLHVLFNATHGSEKLYQAQRTRFLARGVVMPRTPETYPSLPRNLRVAEGLSDFHVATGDDSSLECGGGYIWDNAPDYLILKNAGGDMRCLSDGMSMTFGDPRQPMPSYIAIGDKKLGKKLFPEP